MTPSRIYLDANATAPVLPDVADAVTRALHIRGNPSSLHASGREAARLLSESRTAVARALNAEARDVAFTSGGTEANRLGILGALAAARPKRHVVASAIEHSSVRELLAALASEGVETSWIRPAASGRLDADAVRAALRDDTALVAVQWANNETGVLQPVVEIAAACRERGVTFLCDAVQAFGKAPVDFRASGTDVLTVSAHKAHGPRGVGALVVRSGARWKPPVPSHHEMGRRAGTEALPLIAGFAVAAESAARLTDADRDAIRTLRDRFESALVHAVEGVAVNGAAPRVPNTTNLCFAGVESERLLAALDRAGIDAGAGSACTAAVPEPSHVLLAMGRSPAQALSAVRWSLSRLTTREEVDRAVAVTIEAVLNLRVVARR